MPKRVTTGRLAPETRNAFQHMWEMQQKTGGDAGGWPWIEFYNEPWEGPDSPYYRACLAAYAVGIAPEGYAATPEVQEHLKALREYLHRGLATQSLSNQATLLWASTRLNGIVSRREQQAILEKLLRKQQSDGGWSLSSLESGWQRHDGTAQASGSDGYATAMIVLVSQQMGLSRDDVRVKRGLTWLGRNQNWWDGHWSASSLNHRRHNPFSNAARFMDDAATAYAVIALTEGNVPLEGSAPQTPGH